MVGASLFVALCARVTLPLPFTPVPLTLQNFGVLLVGLTLGSRRGFAALALYLAEGWPGCRCSVQPARVALLNWWGRPEAFCWLILSLPGIAGWILENGRRTLARALTASIFAEIALFARRAFMAGHPHSFVSQAVRWGLYWFVFAEVIKIMSAAALADGWQRIRKVRP